MKLEEYFECFCVNKAWWCRKYRFTFTMIERYRKGLANPSQRSAEMIEHATMGHVTVREMRDGKDDRFDRVIKKNKKIIASKYQMTY